MKPMLVTLEHYIKQPIYALEIMTRIDNLLVISNQKLINSYEILEKYIKSNCNFKNDPKTFFDRDNFIFLFTKHLTADLARSLFQKLFMEQSYDPHYMSNCLRNFNTVALASIGKFQDGTSNVNNVFQRVMNGKLASHKMLVYDNANLIIQNLGDFLDIKSLGQFADDNHYLSGYLQMAKDMKLKPCVELLAYLLKKCQELCSQKIISTFFPRHVS